MLHKRNADICMRRYFFAYLPVTFISSPKDFTYEFIEYKSEMLS